MKKDLPDHEVFSGAGNKLSDEPVQPVQPVQPESNISSKIEEAEPFDIKIDPKKPVTKLRMRFSDGTQKVQGSFLAIVKNALLTSRGVPAVGGLGFSMAQKNCKKCQLGKVPVGGQKFNTWTDDFSHL